jgi:hypothetical protein
VGAWGRRMLGSLLPPLAPMQKEKEKEKEKEKDKAS